MIKRKLLIDLKTELGRVKKTGRVYSSESFGLLISANRSASEASVAFIVSKKVSLKSVERHMVKRRLAQAIGEYLTRLPRSTMLVFLAKPNCIGKSLDQLKQELEVLLRRSQLI